ncbi:hypothetical protein [Pseudomonas sp. PB3P13]
MSNIGTILAAITLSLFLVACKPEHINNAELLGTVENRCMHAALIAVEEKYKSSYSELAKLEGSISHIYIGAVDFKFLKSDSWKSENIYPDKILENGSKFQRPGIVAASRLPIRDLSRLFPGVIQTKIAPGITSFVVIVTCRPDMSIAPGASTVAAKFYPLVNRKLGVYESHASGDLVSIPINTKTRNPDSTLVWTSCNSKLTKICFGSFVLVPGVLVQYRYPIEQRADWERIQSFIVTKLNASIRM